MDVISVLNDRYSEHFGFTPEEVSRLLEDYGLSGKKEEARQWYDGYLFGTTEVYNPWSVINYVATASSNYKAFPKPYWSNTSSNSIVKELVEQAGDEAKEELEVLIAGGSIEKQIHEDITCGDIHKTQDNLWNFLFFTGYLKAVSQRFESPEIYLTMKIPNEEIRYIYRNTIREWFEQKVKQQDFTSMYRAMLEGDAEQLESDIRKQLAGSISYHDSAELFYHGFLLGLIRPIEGYRVVSNRETGDGRTDIILKPYDERRPAVILELKCVKKLTELETGLAKAVGQIKERNYIGGVVEEGYVNVCAYGICFCKKSCRVAVAVWRKP